MRKQSGRRLVNRVLRGFIQELRAIFKRVAPERYRQFPNAARCCHTCAFNPSTDNWYGWDKTAYELMKAIRDHRPFYCHENLPWRTPVSDWTREEIQHFMEHRKLCGGFAAIQGDPKTREAFIVAALRAQGKKPAQAAIDLAMSAIEGAGDVLL
jgi:hypothetical protein